LAKDAIVSADLAQKFATEKDTPYLRYVRGEGLDILDAHYIANLRNIDLKPWARRGGRGVFLNHEASRTSNDCYVCEIPPGGKLEPRRQMYEEMIYVLDGRGSTTVWKDAGKRVTFEWKEGSIFGIPLNCWHQHFNGLGAKASRFIAVTNAPPVINLYEDLDFIFNTPHDFKNRFSGEPDYFAPQSKPKEWTLETNFIPDTLNLPLPTADVRGAGGGHIRFNLARASVPGHISQFPVGTYKKAHAHGPGAHVIILSGEGYTLDWPDENEEPKRLDWQVGTMIVPRGGVFHQHFNTGRVPGRYLAFKHSGSARNSQGVLLCFISKRIGGDQLDYADESVEVREMFSEELAKNGVKPQMQEYYEKELATLPPKTA
jgi:oxalate decarboxylase/phosphoglucose isomerase-like protein (cupin superfamily)